MANTYGYISFRADLTMEKKYQVIIADPPWRYSFSKSSNRKIENHYGTMNNQDICNLNVPADDNCVLFLWATAPKLIEALEVMKSWGFKYKTQMIWDKCMIGMGYWFRGQHEILLVGTKGHISPPTPQHRFSSVFKEKRNKHSKKPRFLHSWLKEVYPDYDKIELFARQTEEGWDVWGNEVS